MLFFSKLSFYLFFFFKQKTAYEMRISDWSSDVCSSDLLVEHGGDLGPALRVVMLSGDWIPLGLPARVKALANSATIYGLGGATEASIWSNWFHIERIDPSWRSIPYGWPLANQRFQDRKSTRLNSSH